MCDLNMVSRCAPECKILYDLESDALYCRDGAGVFRPFPTNYKPMADTVYAGNSSTVTSLYPATKAVPCAACILIKCGDGMMSYRRGPNPGNNRLN